jgi:ABC-type uncharacterized transport system auxiliary subunit
MRARWTALAVALLASGCLFRDTPAPRFFRPESAALDAAAAPASAIAGGVPLHLRPVRGTPLLRERIVWRASPVEYGLYDQRRWSDLPASYVARALESALRATPGVRLSDAPGAVVLRVEVVAFDEVIAPARVAAVSLAVRLIDTDRFRLIDRTFSVESPIADATPAATAVAMGRALDEAVAAVAGAVGETLQGR